MADFDNEMVNAALTSDGKGRVLTDFGIQLSVCGYWNGEAHA